jgi:hypothetical protein
VGCRGRRELFDDQGVSPDASNTSAPGAERASIVQLEREVQHKVAAYQRALAALSDVRTAIAQRLACSVDNAILVEAVNFNQQVHSYTSSLHC